jgi:glycosyltransferase involved in cell wall biosynthesis
MNNILFEGPVLSYSGYGTHCRQIFSWLYESTDLFYCNITDWGTSNWIVSENYENQILKKVNNSQKVKIVDGQSIEKDFDFYIKVATPVEFSKKAKYNIGITAGIEADICGRKIVDYCNLMDMIIVPSEFAKKTILDTAKKENIDINFSLHVIHEYFPETFIQNNDEYKSEYASNILNDLNLIKTNFNFLLIGQMGILTSFERKNILNSIAVWAKTFEKHKNVGLIIKTHLNNFSSGNTSRLLGELNAVFKDIPIEVKKRIHLINGRLDETEIKELYRHPKVSCLYNLAYAEGFCLPALEAASLGLPVIISSWSGHCDFMDLYEKRIRFNHKIDKVQKEWLECWGGNFKDMFVEHSKWAHPDYEDVSKKLLKFYEQPSMPKEWAKELQKRIIEKFSKQKINNDYNQVLGKLLQNRP